MDKNPALFKNWTPARRAAAFALRRAQRAQATAARNYARTCDAITRAYKANHEAMRRLDMAQIQTRAAVAEAIRLAPSEPLDQKDRTQGKALKFVIDDLYGAGDGDEDSPRYLDPGKEWSADTANEVRESLNSLIDTPDPDPKMPCDDCGGGGVEEGTRLCFTCANPDAHKDAHQCPNAARALIEWCDVCGAELTETGTCLNDHLEEDEGDEPSGYCGTCGEKL